MEYIFVNQWNLLEGLIIFLLILYLFFFLIYTDPVSSFYRMLLNILHNYDEFIFKIKD